MLMHRMLITPQPYSNIAIAAKVVERAWGVTLTKDELGGPMVHLYNGVVDNLAEDEHDAMAQVGLLIDCAINKLCC
jgi:acetyl-CoA carboxylase carboxyltransferase component